MDVLPGLAIGMHSFRAEEIDDAGNTLQSNVVNYTVTDINIDIANGSIVTLTDSQPTLRGRSTAPAGSPVTVTVRGKNTGRTFTLVTAVANGRWSVSVPSNQALVDDTGYDVDATVTSGVLQATDTQELVVKTITAFDYTATTMQNTDANGRVAAVASQGDALSYRKDSSPAHGTVTVAQDGSWVYTPAMNYTGTDSFTVVAADEFGGEAVSVVTVTVQAPNTVPTVSNETVETLKNTAKSGSTVGNDVDGDTLTYRAGTVPTHGTVVVNSDGTWTYTPVNDYVGQDSFTVVVSDGNGGEVASTITVDVKTNPTVGDDAVETLKNEPKSGAVVGSDEDGDVLSYRAGTAPMHGMVVVNTDGTWTYTPTTDYVGQDSFTIIVSDGRGGEVASTITIDVKAPNQLPAAGNDTVETLKNEPKSGAVAANDADGDTLTYRAGTVPTHGTVVVNADGTWTYTPANNYVGQDSFTVIVSDGKGGEATSTITVDVKAPNQLPVAGNDAVETLKNEPKNGAVAANDADGDMLTYRAGTAPTHGTVVVNTDGAWAYTPATDYVGQDSFTVIVSDGKGGEATSTITVEVKAPNEAPMVTDDAVETLKNTPKSGTVIGYDPEGDTLTYRAGQNPAHGTVAVNANGTWTYTPANHYVGPDSFTVIASDSKGSEVAATITVDVKAPNEAPITTDDAVETLKHTPKSGTVVANDPEGDRLAYRIGNQPGHGTVAVDVTGKWTYTPANNYVGSDSFTVIVSDGKGGEAIATITVEVKAPNEAPITTDDAVETLKNTTKSGTVVANDPEGDTLAYRIGNQPGHGTVAVDATGKWTYTPQRGYVGTDRFTVIATDANGNEAVATIDVQVKAPEVAIDITGEPQTTVDQTPTIDGIALPTESSEAVIEIIDSKGQVVETAPLQIVDGTWSYQVSKPLRAGVYSVRAKLIDAKYEEERISTQQLIIAENPATIDMKASPNAIVADGKARTTIAVKVADKNGNAIAGEKVTFSAEAGTLVTSEAVTNEYGIATVEFISPNLSGGVDTVYKTITAKVNNPDKGLQAEETITLTLLPASIRGEVIDDRTGKPIVGARVEIREDFDGDGVIDFEASTITDADGKYKFAVPYGDRTYKLHITAEVEVEDKTFPIEFDQVAKVGTSENSENIPSEETVSGQLFMTDETTNTVEKISTVLKDVEITPVVLNDPEGKIDVQIDATGRYQITGGERGKTYEIALHMKVKDEAGQEQVLAGQLIRVSIPEDGVASIQSTLIDPYGTVTDSETGEVVEGAEVSLYWADTELNRSKGRTPHTLVNLPILEDFAPNQNKDPQLTTKYGAYAWLVFPEGDYYIVAKKEGYKLYDSRTEGRNVAALPGEDSYIENGVIHVGQSIVKYDFAITPIKKVEETPNQAPTAGAYSYQTPANTAVAGQVTGTDEDGDVLGYRIAQSPANGTVALKPDGSFVYTPFPGFSGVDRFTVEVVDVKGATALAEVSVAVLKQEEAQPTVDFTGVETFQNKTISGKLQELLKAQPASLQVKAPEHGTVDIDLEAGTWTYEPNLNFTGEDTFVIYYEDEQGQAHQQVVKVRVYPVEEAVQIVEAPQKQEEPKQESTLVELPKTGSPLDRGLLMGLGGAFAFLGGAFRMLGRRNKDK